MIRILVPLDGSPVAEIAVRHAAAIARTFLAEIELVSVVGASKSDSETRIDSIDWQLRKRQSELYLSRTAETLRDNNLNVGYRLREGDPAQEIIRHIDEAEIDLLVLSRYGRGDALQFSGGGTAQKVISASPASVLLVDPAYEFDEDRGYARILVAVDGSQRAEWASTFAAMLAQTCDGALHLLHIVEEPHLPSTVPATGETRRVLEHVKRMARSQAACQLNHLTSRLGADVDVKSTIAVADNVATTIESVAEDDHADLLVVAAEASQAQTPGRYGPTCETLLAHVRRPVLVLRSEPAELSTSNFRSVFLDESCADAV